MEKNAILAIVLSVVVLLVWQLIFVAPVQQKKLAEEQARQEELAQQQEEEADGAVIVPEEPSQGLSPDEGALPVSEAGQQELDSEAPTILIDTPLYTTMITTQGARLLSWQLNAHDNTHGEPVDLVSEDARRMGRLPLEVFTGNADIDDELNQGRYTTGIRAITLTDSDDPHILNLEHTTRSGIRFVKRLTFFPDTYTIQVAFEFEGASEEFRALSVAWGPGLGTDLGLSARFDPQVVLKTTEKAKPSRESVKKVEGLTTRSNVTWAAVNRKYFTAAFFPDSVSNTLSMNTIALPVQEEDDKVDPIRQLLVGIRQPLQDGACQLSIYAGPKEYARLTEVFPGFESLIDYGTFWFIAKPLAAFITFLYGYVHNYGIVIICLTILIKIIFYPLTHKSYKSMQRMQDIQPKMKAVQEKYKKDKQQQQQAMMELYKQEGVNPMGGCFPMLLQIPVFFALYQTLLQSIELRGAPFLWISDLSAPEPAFLGFLKPLVLMMGASMFLQQSMTPTTTDNRQAQIFKFMPILFTAMFWNFPSGLVLYWFMNNILTIGQQYLIKKGGAIFSKTKDSKTQQSSSSRKRRSKGN